MIAALVSNLTGRGMSVTVEGERLAVRPASRLTDADRELLRRHKAELLAHLTRAGPEPWVAATAIALMHGADGAVAASGASGRHPDVRAAVERVWDAHRRHDLGGVRAACAELVGTVARLARA